MIDPAIIKVVRRNSPGFVATLAEALAASEAVEEHLVRIAEEWKFGGVREPNRRQRLGLEKSWPDLVALLDAIQVTYPRSY